MLELVLSRGVGGPELKALRVARFCGVPTGGAARVHRGRRCARRVRGYVRSADNYSRRQVLTRRICREGAMPTIGPVSPALR